MKGTQDVGSFSACVRQPDKHEMRNIDLILVAALPFAIAAFGVVSAFHRISP